MTDHAHSAAEAAAPTQDIRPIDPAMPGLQCTCTFTPYREPDAPGGKIEESWHYLRKCQACGHEWYGLHCPHDGNQNPCPACNARPSPVPDRIVWQGVPRKPTALVLLPWSEGGTTVAERDADGTLYGCRDVGAGPSHDGIVEAWKTGATGKGLAIDDQRPTPDLPA